MQRAVQRASGRAARRGGGASRAAALSTFSRAVVRELPSSFATQALREHQPVAHHQQHPPIDQRLAERQHRAYCAALEERAGLRLSRVRADERHPDCVFVEDTAVCAGGRAVVCRPGHPSRRGEEAGAREALEELLGARGVTVMHAPATCDGGDVLVDQAAGRVLVGLSSRTNREGAEVLREALGLEVHLVEVPGNQLHLKSLVSLVGDGTLAMSDVVAPAMRAPLEALGYAVQVTDAPGANNVLANGVLFAAAASATPFETLDLPGVREVVRLDTSEVAKADGALTCCSLLLP